MWSAWGYMGSFLWLPYATWRAVRGVRAGATLSSQERVQLTIVPLLIAVIQVLLRAMRATPLRYGYPLL